MDETIELILEDPGGNLPFGWTINVDGSTENFTVIDNNQEIFFGDNPNHTAFEGRGSTVARLFFSSPLAEEVTILFTVTGDPDAYSLSGEH